MTDTTKLTDFLDAFARESGIDRAESEEVWADWSRMLPDRDRERIESGGRDAGVKMGVEFRAMVNGDF